MKKKFIIFLSVLVAMFSTSCVTEHPRRAVTLEQALKMPPVEMTLDKIDITYGFIRPFVLAPRVDLYSEDLNGFQIDVSFFPASSSVVDFVRTLREGQRYSFPQIFQDYLNSHSTNTIKLKQ